MNMHFKAEAWTEQRVEDLKRLYAEGHSSSQIALQLGGGVTRNAVIGKVGRLGLKRSGPSLVAKARAQIKERKKVTVEKVKAVKLVRAEAPAFGAAPFRPGKPLATVVDPIIGIPFLDAAANPHVCHWPLWTEEKVGNCCGAPPVPGRPYCPTHEARSRGA